MKNPTEKKLDRVLKVLLEIRDIVDEAEEQRVLNVTESEIRELADITISAVRP